MFNLSLIKASDMAEVYESIMDFLHENFCNLNDPDVHIVPGDGMQEAEVTEDENGFLWASKCCFGYSYSVFYQLVDDPEQDPILLKIAIRTCTEQGVKIVVQVEGDYYEIDDMDSWREAQQAIMPNNSDVESHFEAQQAIMPNNSDVESHFEAQQAIMPNNSDAESHFDSETEDAMEF
jgi:hypothetical protein